jgi:predicted nucleotidyltransferase component of viral defense system
MLELRQIEAFYPQHLRHFKRNLLREYLQYKILAAVYSSRYGSKLVFMGGTAIHIVHGAQRFSEDLDFDNRGITRDDFRSLTKLIAQNLSREGLDVESGSSFKGAFSADIKIKGLLFESGISGHRQEKILVKLDAEPQEYAYVPERFILNKFDVFSGIGVVPADILLAQKFFAILMRKRVMGRDLFDAMFLAGKTKPDIGYLKARAGITDIQGLRSALLRRCAAVDLKQLAKDTAPLLFSSDDARRILLFAEFVRGLR